MIDILAEIHKKLNETRRKYEAKLAELKTNKEAAIAYARFFTDTVDAIAPDDIVATWYGSYTNPGVANYPVLTIRVSAKVNGHWRTLFDIHVNADGKNPPDVWSQAQILAKVDAELARVQREAALFELL